MKPASMAQSISILFRQSYGRIGGNSKQLRNIRCQNSLRKKTCAAHFIVTRPQAMGTTPSRRWRQLHRSWDLSTLGIADHSRSSTQAHGLDEAKLRFQIASIRTLNNTLRGFRLFAGVECDILRDGSLDFPDEVLAELDYVVASVHSVFNLGEVEMTRRVIRAMENPFVTMLAHPTGRLLLKRDPYPIDIPQVLDAAARTGTWIELDAAPKRLDLDWRWWPLAKQKGVKCVINPKRIARSDCEIYGSESGSRVKAG